MKSSTLEVKEKKIAITNIPSDKAYCRINKADNHVINKSTCDNGDNADTNKSTNEKGDNSDNKQSKRTSLEVREPSGRTILE